jgi:hypothetical protein
MIRAPIGDQAYWDRWAKFGDSTIETKRKALQELPGNPTYEPQYVWSLALECPRQAITRYSRGDPIRELPQHFAGLLEAWELSNKLSAAVCAEHGLKTCRDWEFELTNLNYYNWCFWLVGLALALEIPEDQWQRLLALIGSEGEDVLLDRVIACRQPGRHVGTTLLHAKPYARLLKAVDAGQAEQAALLREFVDHWYTELKRPAPQNRKAPTVEPYWYIYGDPDKNPLSMGSYFGRWCIEAAAAVKAFGLDDSLCLGNEHYPGDLLRPDGPSTHKPRDEDEVTGGGKSWLSRLFSAKK